MRVKTADGIELIEALVKLAVLATTTLAQAQQSPPMLLKELDGTRPNTTYVAAGTPGSEASVARVLRDVERVNGILSRAKEALGLNNLQGQVVHYHAVTSFSQAFQSDRTYPPFFSSMMEQEAWFDPGRGVLRVDSRTTFPGISPSSPAILVDDGENAESIIGAQHTPVSHRLATERYLNPFAVIADWVRAGNSLFIGTKIYRDYPRTVLQRDSPEGRQWLFLDPKSGFPVKLEFVEPHYLWAQRRIEYVWSNWLLASGVVVPGSAFRIADDEIEMSQTVGSVETISPEKAPALGSVPHPGQAVADLPLFLRPIAPQTFSVAPNVWILSNPGYNEALALINDEIWILDATQGEQRAREDSDAIAKLIPGKHKINLVVTDLAWPHVAGLRYWVSEGANIISHSAARDFLQKVIDRKWPEEDALEKKRQKKPSSIKLTFVPIDQIRDMAGGKIRLVPIDGIGSEVALLAYLPGPRFLWASDYIQTLDGPSLYAREVMRAAERAGIMPQRFAAEHLGLSEWSAVGGAQSKGR
jgi:hypothetical protein